MKFITLLFIILFSIICVPKIKKYDVITVMVIDTGIGFHKDLVSHVKYEDTEDYVDTLGHGTHVSGIIIYGNEMPNSKDEVCKNVKLISCKFFDPSKSDSDTLENQIKCVKLASKLKINYINISGGGGFFSKKEYLAYKEYIKGGGIVTAAAGNEGNDLRNDPYYPASYAFIKENPLKIYAVENVDSNGLLVKSSNYHSRANKANGNNIFSTLPDNHYGRMTGTSMSSPMILHTILKHRCKDIL